VYVVHARLSEEEQVPRKLSEFADIHMKKRGLRLARNSQFANKLTHFFGSALAICVLPR
jgi:hypothetical protein